MTAVLYVFIVYDVKTVKSVIQVHSVLMDDDTDTVLSATPPNYALINITPVYVYYVRAVRPVFMENVNFSAQSVRLKMRVRTVNMYTFPIEPVGNPTASDAIVSSIPTTLFLAASV